MNLNLAMVQMQRHQYDDAIERFKRAYQAEPKNPIVLSNLGFAFYQRGGWQESANYLERALAETKGSPLADQVDVTGLHNQLGYCYLQLGRQEAAMGHFKEACNEGSGIDCHQRLGEMYFQGGMWDDAIREMMSVLKVKRDDPNLYGVLGVSLAQKGKIPEALSAFDEGLRRTSDKKYAAGFHRNKANLYMQNNQIDSAKKEFHFALSLDWNSAESHFGLALAYLASNQAQEARQSLKNTLTLDPSHQKAKEMLTKLEGGK